MKTTEDFADVILKLLNPGLPYGEMHSQRLKLIEKLRVREETIVTQTIQAERTKRDEMVGLLKIARCPDSSCDNEGTAVDGYGEPYQCRWCYERDGITQPNNQN